MPVTAMAKKFNFLDVDAPTEIRIRATARDKFAGLRGSAYIHARQLNQQVQRVQTSALTETSIQPKEKGQ